MPIVQGLLAAGFEHVQVVDSGADLNAYAKVENQAGCCSPAMETRMARTRLLTHAARRKGRQHCMKTSQRCCLTTT